MEVRATTEAPLATAADTIVLGVFEDEGIAHDVGDGELQALIDAGEAQRGFKRVAVAHAADRRWVLVGLGRRTEFDAERARAAAAAAQGRAAELGARSLCWEVPHHVGDDVVAALVEGTVLAAYRFDRYKRAPSPEEPLPPELAELIVSAHDDVRDPVARAAVVAAAQNDARDLQNAPANELTPTRLGERAQALAAELDGLSAVVEGRDAIVAHGMGAFAAVARGSEEEPALITLRYEGPGARGPVLGYVGKAVTFDSGGISLKPGLKMQEMKFDMSGGAAVLGAVAAIARLGLPVRLVAVIGATENLPSGRAIKPGDIVTAMNGTTIEVNNTDAEGRLVLADCLGWAIEQGAERLVDLATLTGAIVTALGSTHAGLFATDDAWAETVAAAASASGELVWRLPLHAEYAKLIEGQYGDISNLGSEPGKAGSIVGAEFLRRFVGDTPWAHVDIAGTAYHAGKPYAAKGGSGFGVRLLVELARATGA